MPPTAQHDRVQSLGRTLDILVGLRGSRGRKVASSRNRSSRSVRSTLPKQTGPTSGSKVLPDSAVLLTRSHRQWLRGRGVGIPRRPVSGYPTPRAVRSEAAATGSFGPHDHVRDRVRIEHRLPASPGAGRPCRMPSRSRCRTARSSSPRTRARRARPIRTRIAHVWGTNTRVPGVTSSRSAAASPDGA